MQNEELSNKQKKQLIKEKKQAEKEKKAQKKQDEEIKQAAIINTKISNSKDPAKTYKEALGFPAGLFVSYEACKKYLEIGVPYTKAKKVNNIYWALAAFVIVFTPLFFVLIKQSLLIGLLLGVLLAAGIIYSRFRDLEKSYRYFVFERQKDFNFFEQMLLPLLVGVSNGHGSVVGSIRKVGKRIPGRNNKRLVDRLLYDISRDSQTATPYTDFAKAFSNTTSAQLFMYSVYRMSQGDMDTNALRNLSERSNKEQIEQSKQVVEMKLHRFGLITTRLLLCDFITIFAFCAAFFISVTKQIGL